MAYTPIVKLDNFTSKEDDAQVWLNDSLINKPQDFNAFKVEFLRYFSNNNSINRLVNTFTTMKQRKTDAVTRTRDFESAEFEANHAQAVNLVMNKSSELDSKLKQFSDLINQKLKGYLADNSIQETTIIPKIKCVSQHRPISSGSQRCVFATTISTKSGTISKHLSANNTAANLPSINISDSSLSTTATSNISTTTTHNILATPPQNSVNMTSGHPRPRNTQNWKLAIVVHQLISSFSNSPSGLHSWNSGIKDATTNNSESNQQQALTNNILPATVTNNKLLVAIFFFDLKEMIKIPLFSGTALEEKLITTMYIDAKINVDQAVSARIITANEAIKTPIGKIDNLPIEINGIMVPIKVLVMEATQYQAFLQLSQNGQHTQAPTVCGHFKPTNSQPLIELEKETKKPTWEAYQQKEEHTWETTIGTWIDDNQNELPPTLSWEEKKKRKKREDNLPKEIESTKDTTSGWTKLGSHQTKITERKPTIIVSLATANGMAIQKDRTSETTNHILLAANSCLTKECRTTFLVKEKYATLHVSTQFSSMTGYPHDEDKIWRMANAKVEGATPNKILEIKNNPPKPEEKPISSCTLESELPFDPNLNSDNDNNKNTNSSSIQIGNNNDNDSNSDSNSDPKYEQYIALPDLSKEQELKWYSDNNKNIMPERAHNNDAGFDLRYPGKNAIKLEPHSCTYIDLKIALEISATTIVQLAFRSSLAKRGINIREGIIDAGYVENIITMLQNDSEEAYIIEPNEKIAQAIFLPLVRVAQLVLVRKRKKLRITVREIQGFGLTGRVDVPVNMAEEEIVDQGEIISTGQTISIPPYGQYMIGIKREVKNQIQIFKAEPTLCKSGEIGLINFHIPAKDYSHIKIPIYNNTGNVIVISAGTTIGYLSTKIEDQSPSTIPDFSQLCEYVDITSQTIYGRSECYLLQPEQLEQMNIGNLDPLQCMQLKMLLNNFNDIFASKNEFGQTDIIQHQIKTGDAMPIK
ncbi:hypothetical protein G9A89_011663 [Geosiphon pyriformis]|nr:hypothetical protein G9A89_011663 [Geosiphon pyriformis]